MSEGLRVSERATAAEIHLVSFGTDPNAPWEVVGTDRQHPDSAGWHWGTLARQRQAVRGERGLYKTRW
ncbi:hypothetical protein GCM10009838_34070 [Catenulispora subtropica]|uniref:Uncharacterized protein n=1 Tax=Catenulispora subtropica TaxID=450798 RepID=A0ABP5D2W7_9ACTN